MLKPMEKSHRCLWECTSLLEESSSIIRSMNLRGRTLNCFVFSGSSWMCDVLNFSFKLRNQQHLGYLDGQPADLSTFRRAWTNELPWIRIANSVSWIHQQLWFAHVLIVLCLSQRHWVFRSWLLPGSDVYSVLSLHIPEELDGQNSPKPTGNFGGDSKAVRSRESMSPQVANCSNISWCISVELPTVILSPSHVSRTTLRFPGISALGDCKVPRNVQTDWRWLVGRSEADSQHRLFLGQQLASCDCSCSQVPVNRQMRPKQNNFALRTWHASELHLWN